MKDDALRQQLRTNFERHLEDLNRPLQAVIGSYPEDPMLAGQLTPFLPEWGAKPGREFLAHVVRLEGEDPPDLLNASHMQIGTLWHFFWTMWPAFEGHS